MCPKLAPAERPEEHIPAEQSGWPQRRRRYRSENQPEELSASLKPTTLAYVTPRPLSGGRTTPKRVRRQQNSPAHRTPMGTDGPLARTPLRGPNFTTYRHRTGGGRGGGGTGGAKATTGPGTTDSNRGFFTLADRVVGRGENNGGRGDDVGGGVGGGSGSGSGSGRTGGEGGGITIVVGGGRDERIGELSRVEAIIRRLCRTDKTTKRNTRRKGTAGAGAGVEETRSNDGFKQKINKPTPVPYAGRVVFKCLRDSSKNNHTFKPFKTTQKREATAARLGTPEPNRAGCEAFPPKSKSKSKTNRPQKTTRCDCDSTRTRSNGGSASTP